MELRIINSSINLAELQKIAAGQFGDMIKAVVDVEKEIMAVGGELHADGEALLIENNSFQNNLWGINLYINEPEGKWIEFDSMINIRPSQNNRSRNVESQETREKIIKLVKKLVKR